MTNFVSIAFILAEILTFIQTNIRVSKINGLLFEYYKLCRQTQQVLI